MHILILMLESLAPLAAHALPATPYLGPDTMLPLASILAALVGVLLMFGRRAAGLVRRAIRPRRPPTDAEEVADESDITS
jgi:hypothetical protein